MRFLLFLAVTLNGLHLSLTKFGLAADVHGSKGSGKARSSGHSGKKKPPGRGKGKGGIKGAVSGAMMKLQAKWVHYQCKKWQESLASKSNKNSKTSSSDAVSDTDAMYEKCLTTAPAWAPKIARTVWKALPQEDVSKICGVWLLGKSESEEFLGSVCKNMEDVAKKGRLELSSRADLVSIGVFSPESGTPTSNSEILHRVTEFNSKELSNQLLRDVYHTQTGSSRVAPTRADLDILRGVLAAAKKRKVESLTGENTLEQADLELRGIFENEKAEAFESCIKQTKLEMSKWEKSVLSTLEAEPTINDERTAWVIISLKKLSEEVPRDKKRRTQIATQIELLKKTVEKVGRMWRSTSKAMTSIPSDQIGIIEALTKKELDTFWSQKWDLQVSAALTSSFISVFYGLPHDINISSVPLGACVKLRHEIPENTTIAQHLQVYSAEIGRESGYTLAYRALDKIFIVRKTLMGQTNIHKALGSDGLAAIQGKKKDLAHWLSTFHAKDIKRQ